MDDTCKDMLNNIKKGPAPGKIEAYRRLLIGYAEEDGVVAALTQQLSVETNGRVYNQVKALDHAAGPRLNWHEIRTLRLQKCKKADERYDALSVEEEYGGDTRAFLEGVIQNDKDQSVRRRALYVLLAKNTGSDDLSLLTMAQKFLEDEDGLREVERSIIWDAMARLGQSPQQITYFDDVLSMLTPTNARSTGQVLRIMYASGVPYDQKIRSLCQDAYGAELQNDPGIDSDQAKALYDLLYKFCAHGTCAPDFIKYVFALAIGPMVHFAEKHDPNGWHLLRSVRDLLGRSDAQRPLATELLFKLISNESILERERGFAVPYYVGSCRDQGMSEGEIADLLKPFANDGDGAVAKSIHTMLNPNHDALAERELARQKLIEQKRRGDIVLQFASFVVPFGFTYDLQTLLAPVIKAAKDVETFDGPNILQAFIDMGAPPGGQSPILTLDREDRATASDVIDASRHFLGLPAEEDLYTDESKYDAAVGEQFELYAAHLKCFGLSLAYVDAGWDDPCAVVLSQPDAFKAFLRDQFPDLTCTAFA
ncbi:hypothetical protein [Yoonia maritima]|uniref:hypothetical protein n=1 Tax=Yoonia maritima TaxID=1435347 RepID=UPI0037350E19